MPRYRVTNRATREAHTVEAPYAQDACEALGWMIGDCHVREMHDTRTPGQVAQEAHPGTGGEYSSPDDGAERAG